MIEYLKDYSWAVYLGGSLSIFRCYFYNWKWWVVTLPTSFLFYWHIY